MKWDKELMEAMAEQEVEKFLDYDGYYAVEKNLNEFIYIKSAKEIANELAQEMDWTGGAIVGVKNNEVQGFYNRFSEYGEDDEEQLHISDLNEGLRDQYQDICCDYFTAVVVKRWGEASYRNVMLISVDKVIAEMKVIKAHLGKSI